MTIDDKKKEVAKLLQSARTFATRNTKSIQSLLNILTNKPEDTNWPNNVCLTFYESVIRSFSMNEHDSEYLLSMSGMIGRYKAYKKADERRSHYRNFGMFNPGEELSNSGMKQKENRMLASIAEELVLALEEGRYQIDEDTGELIKTERVQKGEEAPTSPNQENESIATASADMEKPSSPQISDIPLKSVESIVFPDAPKEQKVENVSATPSAVKTQPKRVKTIPKKAAKAAFRKRMIKEGYPEVIANRLNKKK